MSKFFILTVALGAIIWKPDGGKQTLNEVPDNAAELWENGSSTLCLKKDGAEEFLKDFSKNKLETVLAKRKALNFPAEIKLLEDALKKLNKPEPKTKPETTLKNNSDDKTGT